MAGSLKKALAGDPEAEAFRLAVDEGVQKLHPQERRTLELHVSAFTKSDDEFCYRQVLYRWWHGSEQEFTTLIQRDGKFRERKWHEVFEAAGILVAYQPEWKLGKLIGHPDWVLDWGYGPRVVDLTGQDPQVSPVLRSMHLAAKKRQVALYNVMAPFDPPRGYVLVEDKATCDFRMVPVPRDRNLERALVDRVVTVSKATARLFELKEGISDESLSAEMARLPSCKNASCRFCGGTQ